MGHGDSFFARISDEMMQMKILLEKALIKMEKNSNHIVSKTLEIKQFQGRFCVEKNGIMCYNN